MLFSGKRLYFPTIGRNFYASCGDILDLASKSYGSDVLKAKDFRALSVMNLAMNLCAYRQFFEQKPEQFNSVKCALGFGLGEVAALVVAGSIDTQVKVTNQRNLGETGIDENVNS